MEKRERAQDQRGLEGWSSWGEHGCHAVDPHSSHTPRGVCSSLLSFTELARSLLRYLGEFGARRHLHLGLMVPGSPKGWDGSWRLWWGRKVSNLAQRLPQSVSVGMLMLPIDQSAEQEPLWGWLGRMTTEIKKHTPPYRTPHQIMCLS